MILTTDAIRFEQFVNLNKDDINNIVYSNKKKIDETEFVGISEKGSAVFEVKFEDNDSSTVYVADNGTEFVKAKA